MTNGADRTRLYRQRRQRGIEIATIEFKSDTLATLVDRHLLSEQEALCPHRVATALSRIIEKWTVDNRVDL